MAAKKGTVTVGEWIVTFIILAIPLVNLIMLFVWAFGGDVNINKQNYAKASLIFIAIFLALYIIIFAMFGAAFMGMFSQY